METTLVYYELPPKYYDFLKIDTMYSMTSITSLIPVNAIDKENA